MIGSNIFGPDQAQVRQRRNETHRAVAAHAEITNVVKKNHARYARLVLRLHQQRAHHHIRAARFVDHRRTRTVELALKFITP